MNDLTSPVLPARHQQFHHLHPGTTPICCQDFLGTSTLHLPPPPPKALQSIHFSFPLVIAFLINFLHFITLILCVDCCQFPFFMFYITSIFPLIHR